MRRFRQCERNGGIGLVMARPRGKEGDVELSAQDLLENVRVVPTPVTSMRGYEPEPEREPRRAAPRAPFEAPGSVGHLGAAIPPSRPHHPKSGRRQIARLAKEDRGGLGPGEIDRRHGLRDAARRTDARRQVQA